MRDFAEYPKGLNRPVFRRTALAIAISLPAAAFATTADNDTQRQARMAQLPQIDVVGSADGTNISRQTGAVTMVSSEELQMIQPRSTEEALRRVPGVYIKPEEESAVVVNVGVRGLSSNDYKTLVLEDGVPVAPGLFVGNGRYYNPRIQRIDNIEVLRGSSALRYGPGNIGGVINYRTKEPADGIAIETSVGSWDTYKTMIELGGSSPSGDGIFGAVISHVKSDGFMDKGYETTDVMIKAGTAIGRDQWLGVKFTHYENDANISYRGLFLDEYKRGEKNNPAPDDYFLTGRVSFDINHLWTIQPGVELNTLVYWSDTYRDYWRFGVDGGASATAGSWVFNDNVNGNNRSFERIGAETRLTADNSFAGVNGEAEIGLRYLKEEMVDQTVLAIRERPRTPDNGRGGLGRDRIDAAESYALYAQNRFDLSDRWSVTPGVRVEYYEQTRKNRQNGSFVRTRNTEVMPGLGSTFQIAPMAQVYGSVYQAFSPALNGDALDGMQDQELDAETSVNLELGVRGSNERLNYEVTAFRMDFKNQIIPANSNTNFQRTNGGKTFHQGLEAAIGVNLDGGFDVFANLTWIPDAEFNGNRFASDGVTINTPDGNRIPYTPEFVANAGVGYQQGGLRTQLSANYTGSQFTDVGNTRAITENTSGFFTGKIDSFTTVDFSTRYAVNRQLELFGAVKNLTDERYIASLRQGIYVGPERSYEAGVRLQF
ncbi:MAG: TonB-dependent receptor [Marinobacter sp.]|nr:TonB-dependent receptor [Marinobacter sp.]